MGAVTLPAHHEVLRGTVTLPTSKSLTNRALVAAAVAGGGTIVAPLDCDDTRVLAAALVDAGWPVEWGTDIEVGERTVPECQVRLDLEDSGTGSRLILALLAASPGSYIVDGSARLRQRPMSPLLDALIRLGAEVRSRDGFLPVEIEGAVLAVCFGPGLGGSVDAQGPRPRGCRSTAFGAIPRPHSGRAACFRLRTRCQWRQEALARAAGTVATNPI
jgi:5-enolpyruvylshikimate-3-phosphate synthase